jgi:hypothetical protein
MRMHMKCYNCDGKMITKYYENGGRIYQVSKVCIDDSCGWESYPVKVPKPRGEL